MTDQYVYSSSGRYDLDGEENAMYLSKTVTGNETEMVPHYGAWTDYSTYTFSNIQVDNLLDLTDPNLRNLIGVDFDMLTKVTTNKDEMYEFTNVIASWARKKGYNGIIAPGAQGAKDYENVILFEQSYIDKVLSGKIAQPITK